MPVITLDQVTTGIAYAVTAVNPPPNAPEWGQWLEDIGFIEGEQVMLMTRAPFGGDPVVVRIGQSTFALRLAEAACVELKATES